jgi:hypothetical protein
MAASCRPRVTWRFAFSHALVASPEPCVWAHALVGAGLVVRDGDLLCETKTCRARRRLVGEAATRVKIGCLAGAGSWQRSACLPWDATLGGECSPSGCCDQQGCGHPQAACQLTEVFTLWMMVLLSSSGIILPSIGTLVTNRLILTDRKSKWCHDLCYKNASDPNPNSSTRISWATSKVLYPSCFFIILPNFATNTNIYNAQSDSYLARSIWLEFVGHVHVIDLLDLS